MIHAVCVNVISRDCSRRVDPGREGALEGITIRNCARARGIEIGDGRAGRELCSGYADRLVAVRASSQEAVIHVVVVKVVSRDCSRRVDGGREGALVRACARGRVIDDGDSALRTRGCLLAIQLQATNQNDHTDYFPNQLSIHHTS
jgi:hypothetical protein